MFSLFIRRGVEKMNNKNMILLYCFNIIIFPLLFQWQWCGQSYRGGFAMARWWLDRGKGGRAHKGRGKNVTTPPPLIAMILLF